MLLHITMATLHWGLPAPAEKSQKKKVLQLIRIHSLLPSCDTTNNFLQNDSILNYSTTRKKTTTMSPTGKCQTLIWPVTDWWHENGQLRQLRVDLHFLSWILSHSLSLSGSRRNHSVSLLDKMLPLQLQKHKYFTKHPLEGNTIYTRYTF